MPTVSVIIPTYNRRELLKQTIESVLAQTYTDYELVVIDDGSTDGTETMVREYCANHPQRVRYVYQENAGESVARQHGVGVTRSPLLAFLDSDDLWLPDKLEKQVAFLEQHPMAAFVYCWASLIDAGGRPLQWPALGSRQDPADFSLERMILNNFIVSGSTLLLRREAYETCGGFNSQIQFAEDWDLCLRLGVDYGFGCLCEPLVQYRLHERGWRQRRGNLSRMLRDHLLIVESFYSIPKIAESPLIRVKQEALANRYANAGFAHLSYGEDALGRECLAKACDLAPEKWSDANTFMAIVADYGISLLAPDHPVDRAYEFVDRVACNLPSILTNSGSMRSRLRAWLYVALAHRSRQVDDVGGVVANALRAMRTDTVWCKNRGLWSLVVRTLLGRAGVGKRDEPDHSRKPAWIVDLNSRSTTLAPAQRA